MQHCHEAKANQKPWCSKTSIKRLVLGNGDHHQDRLVQDFSEPMYGLCFQCLRTRLERVEFVRDFEPEKKGGSVLGGMNARTLYPEEFSDSE